MRFADRYREVGHLKLKPISIDCLKRVDEDRACKREYDATRSENYVANRVHTDLHRVLSVLVNPEKYNTTDILVESKYLDIKFYIEVKCRYKPQIEYDTLLISKSKIAGIIGSSLFPTFIFFINTLEEELLIIEVSDDDFLKQCTQKGDYYLIKKTLSISYEDFISNRLSYITDRHVQRLMNPTELFI